jgi:hypothetical protein
VGGRIRESFYLEPGLADSLPWNLVALLALVAVWRRREPAAVFCAAWWIAVLAFYQIAAYKRRAYLLPALPAEALLAGWYLDRVVLLGMPLPSLAVGEWLRRAGRPMIACILAALVGADAAPPAASARVENGSLDPFDAAIAAAAGTACLFALCAAVRAIRQGDRGAALLATWLCLGLFYAAVLPTGMVVMGRELSPGSLVARIEGSMPPGSDLEICGIGADTSLVLLFYLSNPERARVKPEGSCVARPAPGFYVLSAVEQMRVARSPDASLWRERFADQVRGAKARTPLVFAERLRGASAEPSGAARHAGGPSP